MFRPGNSLNAGRHVISHVTDLKDRLHAVTLELGAATALNQTLAVLNTKLAAAEASPTSTIHGSELGLAAV